MTIAGSADRWTIRLGSLALDIALLFSASFLLSICLWRIRRLAQNKLSQTPVNETAIRRCNYPLHADDAAVDTVRFEGIRLNSLNGP